VRPAVSARTGGSCGHGCSWAGHLLRRCRPSGRDAAGGSPGVFRAGVERRAFGGGSRGDYLFDGLGSIERRHLASARADATQDEQAVAATLYAALALPASITAQRRFLWSFRRGLLLVGPWHLDNRIRRGGHVEAGVLDRHETAVVAVVHHRAGFGLPRLAIGHCRYPGSFPARKRPRVNNACRVTPHSS